MVMLRKSKSIPERIRIVPSRAVSFLVKLGWDISKACGKSTETRPTRVTVREGLIGYVASSFLKLTDFEVADDDTPTHQCSLASVWKYQATVLGYF